MGFDVVVRSEIAANRGQQFLLDGLGFGKRAAGKDRLVVQDLLAHDLVDPGFVDVEFAQLVGDLDRIAAGSK